MQILIVEDEDLEHEGLSNMISSFPLDVSICGHAWNGREGLSLADSLRPDIVITDVRMPIMDGITFCEGLKALLPGCFVIIVSGYEDFRAVCDAVRLQVSCWLVKPVNRDELFSALKDICMRSGHSNRIMQEEVKREKWLESLRPLAWRDYFRSLLLGGAKYDESESQQHAKALGIELPVGKYVIMVAEIEDDPPKDDVALDGLVHIMSAYIDIPDVVAMVPMPRGRLALILSLLLLAEDETILSRLEINAERFREQAARTGCCVGVGVSLVGDMNGLSALYAQACDALRQKVRFGRERVLFYVEDEAEPDAWDWQAQGAGMPKAFELGNMNQVARLSDEFIASLGNCTDIHKAIAVCLELVSSLPYGEGNKAGVPLLPARHEVFEQLTRLQTIPDISARMREWLNELIRAGELKNAGRDEQIVRRIKRIVEQHLSGDLSAEAVASRVYLAASHLRRVFKNTEGITLQDYVLRMRIAMAKQLLLQPENKVTEIALAVGYESVSYFCVVFKQCTGLTPTEYRVKQY